MRKITIAAVLNNHQKEIFNYLNAPENIPRCYNFIKNVLTENAEKLNAADSLRCMNVLKASLSNKYKFASTLMTWMNPELKVGKY